MKKAITLAMFFLICFSNVLYSQVNVKFSCNGSDYKNIGNDRIICNENSVVTIVLSKIDTAVSYVLECLPTPADNKAGYSQDAFLTKINSISADTVACFRLSNFKSGTLYQFGLKLKTSLKTLKLSTIDSTKDSTISTGGPVNKSTIVKKYSYDKSEDSKILSEFSVEAHETYPVQISVGAYISLSDFPEYSLEKTEIDEYNTIRENRINSTQGITIGATVFPFGHDEKIFRNPYKSWFENFILNSIGAYIGVAFSSQNKGIDNGILGVTYSIRNLNIFVGLNYQKHNILKEGYSLNEKYKISDVKEAITSKYLGHLCFGGSVNATVVLSAIGFLGDIIGL